MYLCFIFKPHNKILICKPIRKDPSGEKADIIDRIRLNKQATKKKPPKISLHLYNNLDHKLCVGRGGGQERFPRGGGGGPRDNFVFAMEGGVLPAHTNPEA